MIRFLFVVAAFGWTLAGFAAIERVPGEIVRALGSVRGKPVSSGLVFIDGKYIRPPYRVSRVGNQILVNGQSGTGQLVAWEKFLETQPPSRLKVTEVEDSADSGATGQSRQQEDGVDPAAPKDGGNPSAPAEGAAARPVVRIVETRVGAGADDLDDFEEPPSEKPEAPEKKDEVVEDLDPASPEGEAAAKAKAAAEAARPKPAAAPAAAPAERKTRKVTTLVGKFEMNFRAQKLMKLIDAYRAKLETTLRRGGYLFFGTGLNGAKPYCKGRTSDAAATRELLKKLPELMGRAEESEAFCDSVRSAGLISFITYQISQDLFRHKADSVYLKQRRRELVETDKLKMMMR